MPDLIRYSFRPAIKLRKSARLTCKEFIKPADSNQRAFLLYLVLCLKLSSL